MSITFEKGETTITLPDPAPGCSFLQQKRQTVGRTAGGTMYAYDKGNGSLEVELLFESLTDAEKAALAGFFESEALGCRETFTYTDSGSVEWTARFVAPRLEWTKASANVWDVKVRLEIASVEA